MIELAGRLDPGRWRIHFACFHARGAWLDRARERAASIVEFPIRSFSHAGTVRQGREFGRWCRRQGIRIVHATDLYANIFALTAAAAVDIPVRIGSRRFINPGKSLGQIALQRAAYACAHRVVANSRAAATRLRYEGVSPRRIVIIPNGLDDSRFATRAAEITSRTRRRVLMVANLRREKGHDVLIDAATTVLERFPDATFEIVGDGLERGRLIDRAVTRGVADAFRWRGHRDDVPAIAARSGIFVLPSRSDAFPNALLEGMAAGLPAVATRVGGIPEILDDGRTGLLVGPDDPKALAEALCRLMSDEELAVNLGTAAREHVTSHYSFDRMTAAFDFLYSAELGMRPALERRAVAS